MPRRKVWSASYGIDVDTAPAVVPASDAQRDWIKAFKYTEKNPFAKLLVEALMLPQVEHLTLQPGTWNTYSACPDDAGSEVRLPCNWAKRAQIAGEDLT
jgi:hypothetical protein